MWSGKSCSADITCFCFYYYFYFSYYFIFVYFIFIFILFIFILFYFILFYFIHLLSDPAFRNIWFNFVCIHVIYMYVSKLYE
jgi:hypothetical protein